MKKKAFTLIELLVVIAIIALLLSILIPSLKVAKMHATAIICLSNLNGLSKAWTLYADENGGTVCGGGVGNVKDPTNHWVDDVAGNSTVSDEIQEKERAIRAGTLFPYVENHKAYHCPGDRRYLSPRSSTDNPYDLRLGGYRSYSIAGGLRGVSPGGGWEIMPIQKIGEMKSPGSKYVFVEEADGRGKNAGSWVIHPKSHGWVDPFAIWHNERSTLGYADGHAEKHNWIDQSTIDMSENQTFYQPVYPTDSGEDLDYMVRAYPYASLLP